MIGLINKIGQRKTSKLLCGLSFLLSLTLQVAAYGATYAANLALWIGCSLIVLPNVLLSMSAHFNKRYRLHCIYAQILLLVFNFLILLLAPKNLLIKIYVAEIIICAIVSIILYALPNPKNTKTISRSVRNPGLPQKKISNKVMGE